MFRYSFSAINMKNIDTKNSIVFEKNSATKISASKMNPKMYLM